MHSKEQVLILAKKKHYLLLAPASIYITIFANIKVFVVGVSVVTGLTENISKNSLKFSRNSEGTQWNTYIQRK